MRIYIIVIISLILLVSFIFIAVPFSKNKVLQPFAFNHKVHVESVGLNCKDCHINVEKSVRATIPMLEICKNCHSEEPISTSPNEKELIKYIVENKEIPWTQIYLVPDHVYFSHRRHVTIGELNCTNCHGNVAAMTTPVTQQEIPVTMKNCLNCHLQKKVTIDCLSCHR